MAYLEDKRIDYLTEGPNVSDGWIEVKCLWCSDPSFHLGINIESNFMNCWRCSKKGSIVKYVRELENCGFSEAVELMNSYQNFNKSRLIPQTINSLKYVRELKTPSQFIEGKKSQAVTDFLHRRGFNPIEMYGKKNIYWGGVLGLMRHRMVLPVLYQRKVVTFVGRALSDKMKPKYINWPDKDSVIPIRQTLFGYDDIIPGGSIVVVEGPMDQLKLGPGSVATYGIKWNVEQVSLLREANPNKIFILYDSEDNAQESAIKLSKQIWFCKCEVIMLENTNDPGSLTKAEAINLMDELR